jgi:hypothetical protein
MNVRPIYLDGKRFPSVQEGCYELSRRLGRKVNRNQVLQALKENHGFMGGIRISREYVPAPDQADLSPRERSGGMGEAGRKPLLRRRDALGIPPVWR